MATGKELAGQVERGEYGPLLTGNGRDLSKAHVYNEDFNLLADTLVGWAPVIMAKAIARRLCAAWNACRTIPSDQLAGLDVAKVIEERDEYKRQVERAVSNYNAVLGEARQFIAERDALLVEKERLWNVLSAFGASQALRDSKIAHLIGLKGAADELYTESLPLHSQIPDALSHYSDCRASTAWVWGSEQEAGTK